MGGQRGRGQALPGFDPVLLVSLVGGVCSRSAQKEGKKAAATLTVDSLDTPSSAPSKSWLVVARGASAPLRLVGHLGWVHRHEASPVGQAPRAHVAPPHTLDAPPQIALFGTKITRRQGGGQVWYPRLARGQARVAVRDDAVLLRPAVPNAHSEKWAAEGLVLVMWVCRLPASLASTHTPPGAHSLARLVSQLSLAIYPFALSHVSSVALPTPPASSASASGSDASDAPTKVPRRFRDGSETVPRRFREGEGVRRKSCH